MGIHKFYTWLYSKHQDCFLQEATTKLIYNNIYIDVNYLLHTSIFKSYTEEIFKDTLFKNLDILLSNYVATKRIILAVDGSSPYAKILLQRKRRQLSQVNSQVQPASNKLSSMNLTTGTDFMKKIDNYLKEYATRLKQNYKFLQPEIILIPSSEPNEGEIKLFKKVLDYGKLDLKETHLIIGNDADLVLLAMSVKPITNMYILIRLNKKSHILSINKMITNNFKNRQDFVILSMFMGNDYLPKLKFMNFDRLWRVYTRTNQINIKKHTLLDNKTFNKEHLIKYFTNLVLDLPKRYIKFSIQNYNKEKIINYLEGVLWCYNMYSSGVCTMYDYIYKFKTSVSAIEILMFLLTEEQDINIPVSDAPAIDSNIYTLLVVPKSSRNIIPKKYHKLLDNELSYIFEDNREFTVKDIDSIVKITCNNNASN